MLLSLSICLGDAFAKMPLPDDEWFQSVNLGELQIAQKKDTEAEATLIHAVGMSYVFGALGAATITQLLLGDFYFGRGDYKNAERFYQMASIEPRPADSVRGLKSLTALYLRLNKKEQADTCRALQKKAEIKLAQEAKKNVNAKADYTAYFKKMSERIKEYWEPPATQKNKVVLVKFRLAPDGAISLLHVARSSGVAEADEQALKAIVATAPLPAPMPPFAQPMDMQYTFDPTKNIDPLKRNVPVKILRVDNVDVVDWPATEDALKDAIAQVQASKKAKPEIVADLMIQLGDCYYEQKDSTHSVSAYDKAINFCLENKVGDKIQLKCRQKLALSMDLAEKHLSADKQWHLGLSIITAQKEAGSKSDLDLQSKIDFLNTYARYLYVNGRTRDADGFYKEVAEIQKAQIAAHTKVVSAHHK